MFIKSIKIKNAANLNVISLEHLAKDGLQQELTLKKNEVAMKKFIYNFPDPRDLLIVEISYDDGSSKRYLADVMSSFVSSDGNSIVLMVVVKEKPIITPAKQEPPQKVGFDGQIFNFTGCLDDALVIDICDSLRKEGCSVEVEEIDADKRESFKLSKWSIRASKKNTK